MKHVPNFVAHNVWAMVSNLIKLEYSDWERDDIVVELVRADINNYSYSFISYHKRDTSKNYARYWKWDHWENKLTRAS